MKFGYIRKDGDGHNYIIPEELIDRWDEETGDGDAPEDMDYWDEYWEGGSVSNYKVVISE
jgi:hypothetical protein